MGAWDTGPFDCDDGAEWLDELCRHAPGDLEPLRDTLEEIAELGPDVYIEADGASHGLAAAETLAALCGRPSARLPEALARWLAAQPRSDGADAKAGALALMPAALAVVRRIRERSELRDLWHDAGPAGWLAKLLDLELRLAALQARSTAATR
jgi:hypothetical protein